MQPSSQSGSAASVPAGPSLKPVPAPQLTAKTPKRRGHGWVWAVVLLAGIGVGLYFYLRPGQQQQVVLPATFRTATIANGSVESSLGVNGGNPGGDFVSLVPPTIPGSSG